MKTGYNRELQLEEHFVEGKWLLKNGEIVEDENCLRIKWLIQHTLTRITSDRSGWNILYEDLRDKRLWELSYLESDSQGGGPPSLIFISPDDAREKYEI